MCENSEISISVRFPEGIHFRFPKHRKFLDILFLNIGDANSLGSLTEVNCNVFGAGGVFAFAVQHHQKN